MFGVKQTGDSIDEIMRKVEIGNASDSVLQYMDKYIDEAIQRMVAQWVNADVTQIHSDLGIVNFHEAYRQAIRAHLLLKQKMNYNREAGRSAKSNLK